MRLKKMVWEKCKLNSVEYLEGIWWEHVEFVIIRCIKEGTVWLLIGEYN